MKSIEDVLLQYREFVLDVASIQTKEGRIAQGIIGISTEAGELLDGLKKHMFQEREYDYLNLKEECGDVFFYLTELMASIDTDIVEVIDMNIKKLKSRYPKGEFDKNMSLFRDLNKERKVLEDNEKSEPIRCCSNCDFHNKEGGCETYVKVSSDGCCSRHKFSNEKSL